MSADGERHDQAAVWDGARASGWVELQDVLDRMFEPLARVLVEAAGSGPARLLDVGCGPGGTTLALARRLGAGSDCTGVDIAEPMILAARSRAEREGVRARFVQADAQRHPFDPASFDVIVSRFGVMFFDDFVAAFANLRAAAKPGGALRCIAWRGAAENPFMTAAPRAAAPFLTLPTPEPDAPGQFAFADAGRVRTFLEQSGWSDVDIQPLDVACRFPEQDLVRYATLLGPVARALADVNDATRARVVEAIRPAFDPFVDGAEVHFSAACWMVAARA